jgi:hypothetical protein
MTEWTDNRKAAVGNATNAQNNINTLIMEIEAQALGGDEAANEVASKAEFWLGAAAVMAQCAQVFATLDLADATRERTEMERAGSRDD